MSAEALVATVKDVELTDPDMADAVYIEPVNWRALERVIERERPDALLPTMGGQTALNLAMGIGYRTGLFDAMTGLPPLSGFVGKLLILDLPGQTIAAQQECVADLQRKRPLLISLDGQVPLLVEVIRRRSANCRTGTSTWTMP